jgi:hypothetical protein
MWGKEIPQPVKVAEPLDATGENKPYAGERTPPPTMPDLQHITRATVNKAVPPTGDTVDLNRFVQNQVDQHLANGDVASAENLIDTAAKTAESKWTPPDRPRITPSVANIRENLAQVKAAEAAPNRATPDSLEDQALQQEMREDLERHGWAAEAEARREFIARNSTGVTKADLTGAAETPVRYTKTPGVPSWKPGKPAASVPVDVDDLMGKMNQMLLAAKKAKGVV